MKRGGNFFVAHYDWIAAAVALAVLGYALVLFLGSLGTDADALAAEKAAEVKRTAPGGEAVQAPDLTAFRLATALAEHPKKIDAEVTDAKESFLASERRVFCTQCKVAVPADLKACPACGEKMAEEKPVVLDGDGDGMPDAWEKRYGFNPADPSDAALDADGDGFTNLEEYEAKTDPTDKRDHPDYLDSLTVQLPLKETVLPFYFTGTMKTPSGLKFQFKDPSRAKEYDRGVYSLLAGEEIGKTGFSPKEFVQKTAEKTMGGGMKKKVDASEAIIVRKSDGKTLAMTVDRKGVPVDVQARLVYQRGATQTFDVVAGDTIDLSGTKYTVKEIKRIAKGVAVTLEHATRGSARTIQALEQ